MGDGTAIGIDHVQLAMPAGEEGAAERFYDGLLGIPRVPKPPHLAARGGCWFEKPGIRVHLGVEDGFRPARKAHPALVISGLDALVRRLAEAGHKVREADGQHYVDDPFGNRIELIEAP